MNRYIPLLIGVMGRMGMRGELGRGCVLGLAPSMLGGIVGTHLTMKIFLYRREDFLRGVRFCAPLAQIPRVGPTEGKTGTVG